MKSQVETGGFRIPDTLPDDVFYGFRLDPASGRLTVDVIAGGDGVVKLPQSGIIDNLDYKQWVWTTNTLLFGFSTNGHLEVKIL